MVESVDTRRQVHVCENISISYVNSFLTEMRQTDLHEICLGAQEGENVICHTIISCLRLV